MPPAEADSKAAGHATKKRPWLKRVVKCRFVVFKAS